MNRTGFATVSTKGETGLKECSVRVQFSWSGMDKDHAWYALKSHLTLYCI